MLLRAGPADSYSGDTVAGGFAFEGGIAGTALYYRLIKKLNQNFDWPH
jgi:hypothetical protein